MSFPSLADAPRSGASARENGSACPTVQFLVLARPGEIDGSRKSVLFCERRVAGLSSVAHIVYGFSESRHDTESPALVTRVSARFCRVYRFGLRAAVPGFEVLHGWEHKVIAGTSSTFPLDVERLEPLSCGRSHESRIRSGEGYFFPEGPLQTQR